MESLLRVLATNVTALREHHDVTEPDLIKRGVPAGTAHRVSVGQNVTLNALAKVAKAFKLPAWTLLVAGFDPAHPPALVNDAAVEAEVERRAKERVRELLDEWRRLHVDEETRPDGGSVALPYALGPATQDKSPSRDATGSRGTAAGEPGKAKARTKAR